VDASANEPWGQLSTQEKVELSPNHPGGQVDVHMLFVLSAKALGFDMLLEPPRVQPLAQVREIFYA
jgi:hypothetical protein